MPMLAVHLSIVQEVVDALDIDELREHIGAALLGSTAPDRRVMTREPREDTHFFNLTESGMGDGFLGMKEVLPDIVSRAPDDDWALTAFLVGYASHLAADEAWIVNVYRPYFEDESYLGGEPTKNILDRAMQYELEVSVRGDREQLEEWQSTIIASDSIINRVPDSFIHQRTLREWSEFVVGRVLTLPGTWAEFPRFISRYLDEPGLDETEVTQLMADPEGMLNRVYASVPREIIPQHRAIAMEQSLKHAEEILS